jgi:hypothetical protein
MKVSATIVSLLLSTTSSVMAGEKMSDAEIKQKLVGYWSSGRHGYYIAADGIMYMCPRKYATTTNHWNVKDGKFYWSNSRFAIVTLTDKKVVCREIGGQGNTLNLVRRTKEELDPD